MCIMIASQISDTEEADTDGASLAHPPQGANYGVRRHVGTKEPNLQGQELERERRFGLDRRGGVSLVGMALKLVP